MIKVGILNYRTRLYGNYVFWEEFPRQPETFANAKQIHDYFEFHLERYFDIKIIGIIQNFDVII